MADDSARLQRRIELEKTTFETRRQAVGGSQTADNLADQAAVNSQDLGILANLAGGRPVAAGGQAVGMVLDAAKGMNEGARLDLAKMLMSQDRGDIVQALAGAERSEATRRIMESLLRGAIRSGPGAALLPQ